jgi:hypothetical protein
MGRMSCDDSTPCEGSAGGGCWDLLCGVVKMRERGLTWVRAVPGFWVITSALAGSDDDGRCGG